MPGYYVPKSPACPAQIACEGTLLKEGREICGKCEERLRKKNKPVKLRGAIPKGGKKDES